MATETATPTAAPPRGLEVRSIDYVPLAERHGKLWHLGPLWFMSNAQIATLAVGLVSITTGGNVIWSLLAILAGVIFGTFFMAFHSAQGPQLGLPQMIQSRPQFGYVGALLVWGVALITLVGYCAVNQVLGADSVVTLTHFSRVSTMLLFGIVATALAIVGYDLIHKAQRVLAYLLI